MAETEKAKLAGWLAEAKKVFPGAYSLDMKCRKSAAAWLVRHYFRGGEAVYLPSGSAGDGGAIAAGLNRQQFIARVARQYQNFGAGAEIFKRVLKRASCVPSRPLTM
jgi:hypothetical protein